jgi:hypothetical protein
MIAAQVHLTGPRMNIYEKAYHQLVAHGFCHFSEKELDRYIRKARFRARFAVAFLAAVVLAYFFLIRPL